MVWISLNGAETDLEKMDHAHLSNIYHYVQRYSVPENVQRKMRTELPGVQFLTYLVDIIERKHRGIVLPYEPVHTFEKEQLKYEESQEFYR